jgi:ATP-dependent helicase/nuclease subunit A
VRFAPDGGFELKMRTGMETTRYQAVRTVDETMDEHERIRLLYVALTRARDHLIVSTHHTRSAVNRSHGGRIAARLAALAERADGLAVRWTAADDAAVVPAAEAATPADREVPDAATWEAEHGAFLRRRAATLARGGTGVVSATAIARHLVGAPAADGIEAPVEPAVPEREPWRRGRAGTGIGSAVHAVLQHADLTDPDAADLADLARWQASVEALPTDAVAVVEAKARAAIASPLVARAVASGRLQRELLVAAPTSELLGTAGEGPDADLVEGFVDLCFDEGDGLVVVDYKTDEVGTPAAVSVALERYAPQGAAYALLLEAATGRRVTEVHFLFLRGTEAIDVEVPDLEAQVARVRDGLRSGAGGSS